MSEIASAMATQEHNEAGAQPSGVSGVSVLMAGATAVASASLVACGGGGTNDMPDELNAWRFLNQATFGPTQDDVKALTASGYAAWFSAQYNEPQAITLYDLTSLNFRTPTKIGRLFADPTSSDYFKRIGVLDRTHTSSGWWEKALTGKDQLRQRVAYALSQILVISMQVGGAGDIPFACANYYDQLLNGAFGSYKDLLTTVAGHPAMGVYLSFMTNERPSGNRIPDQNFAREIMQLFSIGLHMLNMDGTPQLDSQGKPIETYTPYDIEVLSHVFTGWGWKHAFGSFVAGIGWEPSQIVPMRGWPEWHSTYDEFPKKDAAGKVLRFPNATSGTITLLGKPLNIASPPDPEADRQAALNIILNHPNVAPFIAKQMIQLMVTSNPSPAYVGRAAKAFNDSNLSIQILVQTILLDPEARDVATVRNDPTYGRLREPILRVTQFVRAFNVKSVGNCFHVPSLAGVSGPSIAECLGQSPLESPTVFNFYRPGYMSPNSKMAALGKVSPEMQISSETEVAAYMRFMEVASWLGFGRWVRKDGLAVGGKDQADPSLWSDQLSVYPDYTPELALSVDTGKTPEQRRAALIEAINKKLFGGAMSAKLQDHLATLADKFSYDDSATGTQSEAQRRIATMTYAALITPEYVVQR